NDYIIKQIIHSTFVQQMIGYLLSMLLHIKASSSGSNKNVKLFKIGTIMISFPHKLIRTHGSITILRVNKFINFCRSYKIYIYFCGIFINQLKQFFCILIKY